MTTLNEYLRLKREAFQALRARVLRPGYAPQRLSATATAEGRSGVRRIRIRDFQVLTDSPRDFVGYDLGPSSPELALGALASCLTHSYLIQAAIHELPVESLEVEVTGQLDQRAGAKGHEATPVHPHGLHYAVRIDTPASEEALDEVHRAVERACPILNLLRHPQHVAGTVRRAAPPSALSPEGVA